MSVDLHEDSGGRVLLVTLTGQLSKADYLHFTPAVERAIRAHGKLRMLVRMRDFHGWSMGALWQDVKFDVRHFADIDRLALVGDKKWEEAMAVFCKPFTAAKIRYFDQTAIGEALSWVREEVWPEGLEPTKVREFEVLDESADPVILEEWQEWVAPGLPGRTVYRLPTGLHVNKVPGTVGQFDVVVTGEKLRTENPAAA